MKRVYLKRKKDVPLTSENHLKATRKEINQENRDRSKRHEKRTADLLKGSRVPLSGAMAQYKGDVIINFIEHPGRYIVECKTSSSVDAKTKIPRLFFNTSWLSKLESEVKSMNAKFGIFVLHYYNVNTLKDYVLISEKDMRYILQNYTQLFLEELTFLLDNSTVLVANKTKNGTDRANMFIEQDIIEKNLTSINGIEGLRLSTPNGVYLLIYLGVFRDIMLGV